MKRIAFRFSISLFTFTIGFSAVLLSSILSAITSSLQTTPKLETATSITSHQQPKFMKVGRGCGLGYVEIYNTPDFQEFREGNRGFLTRKQARAELRKIVAESVRVIERVPQYKNLRGEIGERIVLINPPKPYNGNKEAASILWYGGDNFLAFIDAPSVEQALEFEKFLEYEQLRGFVD